MRKKKKKVLAIITTFNPNDIKYDKSFEDFSHIWFRVIKSWQNERDKNLEIDIVVADCISGFKTRKKLIEFQKKSEDFYIDLIEYPFTSSAGNFNHAMYIFKNKIYDYYAYSASDAMFVNKGDLKILLDEIEKDPKASIISPQADNDMAQRRDYNPKKNPTKIKLGEGVNAHIYLFKRKFFEYYDYKWIDILGGPKTESLIPYLCSAIKTHQLLSHRVMIHHKGHHDMLRTPQPLLNPAYKRNFLKMLKEGEKIGLGFEECDLSIKTTLNVFLNHPSINNLKVLVIKTIFINSFFKIIFNYFERIFPYRVIEYVKRFQGPYSIKHNKKFFDKDGYAKNEDLYNFIKKNVFLEKKELDYKKIPYKLMIPRKH